MLNNNGFRHYWWGNDLDVTTTALTVNNWFNVVARYSGSTNTRDLWLNNSRIGFDNPSGRHAVPNANN